VAASVDSAALALCPSPEPCEEPPALGEDAVCEEDAAGDAAAAAGPLLEPVSFAEEEALSRADAVAFEDMGTTALMDEIEAMDETLPICIVKPSRTANTIRLVCRQVSR